MDAEGADGKRRRAVGEHRLSLERNKDTLDKRVNAYTDSDALRHTRTVSLNFPLCLCRKRAAVDTALPAALLRRTASFWPSLPPFPRIFPPRLFCATRLSPGFTHLPQAGPPARAFVGELPTREPPGRRVPDQLDGVRAKDCCRQVRFPLRPRRRKTALTRRR